MLGKRHKPRAMEQQSMGRDSPTDLSPTYIALLKKQMDAENRDITFLNPYSYVVMRNNPSVLTKFRVEIDGILLAKLLGLVLGMDIKRCSFDYSSIAPQIFDQAEKIGQKVAIVGSDRKSIVKFVETIQNQFPRLEIVYYRDGFFESNDDIDFVIEELSDHRIDVLIVGMGSGRQEDFMLRARAKITTPYVGYSCGGFIHQSFRGLQYYPMLVDKLNLRIFYRLYREPLLWRRHLKFYPKFVILFVADALRFFLRKIRTL